jgi:hypothetical protein
LRRGPWHRGVVGREQHLRLERADPPDRLTVSVGVVVPRRDQLVAARS